MTNRRAAAYLRPSFFHPARAIPMADQRIDALIPLGPNDGMLAELCVRSVRTFIHGLRTIYIVSPTDPGIPGTVFIPESVFPFTMADVREIVQISGRAGWYLQQLLKFYFPLVRPDCLDKILVVDADTLFMNPVRFVEDGKTVFNFGLEFHPPYFEHMERVHPAFTKAFLYSGICHCMLFDRFWVAELIHEVERFHKSGPFWRIFLEKTDPKHRNKSGASEYEMYLSFAIRWHAPDIVLKRLRWTNASDIAEVRPDLHDYVSIHWYKRAAGLDPAALERKIFTDRGIPWIPHP